MFEAMFEAKVFQRPSVVWGLRTLGILVLHLACIIIVLAIIKLAVGGIHEAYIIVSLIIVAVSIVLSTLVNEMRFIIGFFLQVEQQSHHHIMADMVVNVNELGFLKRRFLK